jgi:hypothetical protein
MARSDVDTGLGDVPSQHYINCIFVQEGEHKNLLDFEMLTWLLEKSGFVDVRQVREADLLHRFPGFPERGDDCHSIYVTAVAP